MDNIPMHMEIVFYNQQQYKKGESCTFSYLQIPYTILGILTAVDSLNLLFNNNPLLTDK